MTRCRNLQQRPYEYQLQLSGIPLISEHVLVVNPYNSSCRTWTMWGGVCRGLARGTLSTRETEWDPPPLQHLSSQERKEMLTIYDTVFVQDKLPSIPSWHNHCYNGGH